MKGMSRTKNIVFWAVLLSFLSHGQVQSPQDEPVTLTRALVIAFPEANCRAALPVDPVEYRIVQGDWRTPAKGEKVAFSATSSAAWEEVAAGKEGWFEHKALRCGYAYLSYESLKEQVVLLEAKAHDWVYVNREPRAGNRYCQADKYESWQPRFDFGLMPVKLRRGKNEFLFKCARGRLKAQLLPVVNKAVFNSRDITVPDLIAGEKTDAWMGVVVINASDKPLENCRILASGENLFKTETPISSIPPLSIRKVGIQVKGDAPEKTGETAVDVELVNKQTGHGSGLGVSLDKASIPLRIVRREEAHKRTYISSVDGSVQHYAVLPAKGPIDRPAALVLSLHGAGVEALNQVRSYAPKSWAHIVAPTNRRPYGYNWEDWGRTDALEVLDLVQNQLAVDPGRIYLTGHSMGGHGAWQVGGLFPDCFAAVGPSAGWISFWSYKVRVPWEKPTPLEEMLMRPNLPSNTFALAKNYAQQGVYILHGSDDDDVPVSEARQMAAELAKSHRDFIYHEQPGAGHWWDASPEAGVDCVDWAPLFDFFARHARPGKERVREIHFVTPCPGISASNNWLTIEAQEEPLKLSSVDIHADPVGGKFIGATENVSRIAFDASVLEPKETISVELDKQLTGPVPRPNGSNRIWLSRKSGQWEAVPKPSASLKGPHRYGLFKDAFKNRVLFVYGTKGTRDENAWAFAKARYDAETFWYQGNGSVDIVPDEEFNPSREPDRNIVLYGNADTNASWKVLLKNSPVQIKRGELRVGSRTIKGKNLACLFIRPRPESDIASVAVVCGTGLPGFRAANTIPYLYAGYNFPDILVFMPELLTKESAGVEAAGFFGNDWSVESGEFAWKK